MTVNATRKPENTYDKELNDIWRPDNLNKFQSFGFSFTTPETQQNSFKYVPNAKPSSTPKVVVVSNKFFAYNNLF